MKYLKQVTGVMFMAMATSINIIPYNSDIHQVTPSVATISTPTLNSIDNTVDSSPEGVEDGSDNHPPEKDDGDDDESPEPPGDIELPLLFIKAINPGYNIDSQKETGEFIELFNSTGEELDLTGMSLIYTNTKGNASVLYEFPNGSVMNGETLVLRYYKSPDNALADDFYKTSLALTGTSLQLVQDDSALDEVCWNGKNGCYQTFKSSKPTNLVRNLTNLIFESVAMESYQPNFSTESPALVLPVIDFTNSDKTSESDNKISNTPHCKGLEFSEILTYYEESSDEQFVEFYNSTNHAIDLEGCALRYKNKRRSLTGVVPANGYYAFYPEDFTFTKNPTKSNTLELIDADDTKLDELIYQHGQKKATAYARFDNQQWLITYSPTPSLANTFQEFQTCEEGKVINPATGKCVKESTADSKTLADCPEGKYRNPLTGRCKNIESTTTKECAEGYERNPDTGRCRKIKSENQGTDYPLVPETYADQKIFIAFGAVGLVVLGGISYIVWQYRREIGRTLRKIRNRLH